MTTKVKKNVRMCKYENMQIKNKTEFLQRDLKKRTCNKKCANGLYTNHLHIRIFKICTLLGVPVYNIHDHLILLQLGQVVE